MQGFFYGGKILNRKMNINIPTIFPLISALLVFSLGLFVFFKNKKLTVNKIFALHSLVITIWLFGTFMMFLSRENREAVIFWDRFIYIGVVFIPVILYHFSIAFCKIKNQKKLLVLGYILSFVFLILSRTDYFVSDLFEYKWGVHTKAKFFHHVFLVYFVFYVFLWFYNIYKYYQRITSPLIKQQTKYIFIAFLLLFTIGPMAYLPAYGIGIYPFAYISGLVFTIILAYAILKYRLMDIRVAVKRSTVFTLLVIVISAAYVLAAFLLSWFVFGGTYTLQSQIYIGLIVALLVAIGFRPFYDWLKQITDTFLFKGEYHPQKLIADISTFLSQTLELDKLINFLIQRIQQALRVDKVKVLLLGKKALADQEYCLVRFFEFKNKEPLILEELKRKQAEKDSDKQTQQAIQVLEKNDLALVLPLLIQQKLIGLLTLSSKKSGDMFTQEDVQTLETIASQAAIAIENAHSYQKIKDFSKTLQQEVDRQTKELKQANQELKKLDQAKSEFISMASHQLRTPVSVIKGICSMMKEGDIAKLPQEKQERFLEGLWQKSLKLESIISDILNATEMTSSKYQVRKEQAKSVDLNELIQEIVSDFKEIAKERKIQLKFVKPKKKLPQIHGQKEYLREAISNLIDNAIKYTPSTKGKKQGIVKIFLTKEKDYVMIKIKDNGIGIPEKEIPKLFNKFERASNARDMYTDGSGLGLFIVKEIIQGHHGQVWAESELGKGSQFFIKLPIKFFGQVDVRKHILEE